MTPQTLPNLHLLEDVAEKYGLSLIGLKRKARSKAFTHIKFGKKRYLTDEQLETLLQGATVTSERESDLAATGARAARSRRGRKAAA